MLSITRDGFSARGEPARVAEGFAVSELRTRRRDRGRSPVRCVQGRLSMLDEDEDASRRRIRPTPRLLPRRKLPRAADRVPITRSHRRRSFTRWPIVVLSRTGRWSGVSDGVVRAIRWKKMGSPGETRKPRHSSKSGISFATNPPRQPAEVAGCSGRRAELIPIGCASHGGTPRPLFAVRRRARFVAH